MPIRFQTLFQDVWNFVRNRPLFVLYAVALLTILQIFITKFASFSELSNSTPDNAPLDATTVLLPTLLSMLTVVFVNVLLILNIKSINHDTYRTFLANIPQALAHFVQAILLTLVQMFPISLGLSFALFPDLGSPLLALPLMLTGLYVFIKLNLAIYVYLIESPQKGIGETLTYTWRLSRGRMLPLILFTAIIYFIPTSLGSVANLLAAFGELGHIVGHLLNAFINLLMVIFSFRFYQNYRQ